MADNSTAAEEILRESAGDRVRQGYPLGPLTSFRIGGPATLYLEAESTADLHAVARAVKETALSVVVIGKGSNVLVSDEGFAGLVLRLGRFFRWVGRDGSRLSAGGAMPLPAFAGVALRHRLSGLEFGVAIPASFGGAVRMNAGAHGRSMGDVLDTLDVFDLQSGTLGVLPATDADFDYRTSSLPSASVVVGGTVKLSPGSDESIRDAMREAREWRRATQPLSDPNCGSVFKNPPNDHAARLIEAVGGKALSVGAARVSEKHANFIIAGSGATARDVRSLIALLEHRVLDEFGVQLHREVQFVGHLDS